MPAHTPADIIESRGCSITLKRLEGPHALELIFNCRPDPDTRDTTEQSEAAYRAILDVLVQNGGSFRSVVSEIVFLRDLQANLGPVRAGRERTLAAAGNASHKPATTEIEQPPLAHGACFELQLQAVIPHQSSGESVNFKATTACECTECARMRGLQISVENERRLYAGALYGQGDDSYEQTHAMFAVAEDLLQQAGMAFRDVMRTWIYLPEMERDYAGFNRARREFFEAHGVDPIPASTGIGAGLSAEKHMLSLGFYAVKGAEPPLRTVMTTPTLNEAPVYGSDFSRGMRVAESNRVSLHISGTASLDETGATVYVDDFEAQVDRMLINVAGLLEQQGAKFSDITSAITYVKHPEDATRLQQKFQEAGYEGFPNAIVEALVCRPELLCETEALALLPAERPQVDTQ